MKEFINDLIQSFQNLDAIGWIGQMAGIAAFVTLTIFYQFERRKFLLLSIISYIFFLIESSCALISPNVVNNIMAIVRNVIMIYFLDKYNSQMPNKYLVIMLSSIWIIDITALIITKRYDNWVNYIAPLSITVLSISYNFKSYYITKIGSFVMEFGMLIIYLVYMLPFSIIRQIILVLSVIISTIIMLIKDIKKKRNKDKELEEVELKKAE